MTSTFSFNFSSDDIDLDGDNVDDAGNVLTSMNKRDSGGDSNSGGGSGWDSTAGQRSKEEDQDDSGGGEKGRVEARAHSLKEWIHILPSHIAYNTLPIIPSSISHPTAIIVSSSPSAPDVVLGRREIFDVRAQLMAEDGDESDDYEDLISSLGAGDLKPNFYEGGFKTWECAVDLAKLVVSEAANVLGLNENRQEEEGDIHVIELGAGTALPSLALFAQFLVHSSSEPISTSLRSRGIRFTFSDYNAVVLRLVTLPNLILTWKLNADPGSRQASNRNNVREGGPGSVIRDSDQANGNLLLEIDSELVETFQADLSSRSITVEFVSGAWSPRFVELVFSKSDVQSFTERMCRTLILASETIYSPASLTMFTETLLALLRRRSAASCVGLDSKALVAAKKVYFGVGGGVDEFLAILRQLADETVDVQQCLGVQSEGIGRTILQIQLRMTAGGMGSVGKRHTHEVGAQV